ncbi:MAG: hypothetical protein Q7N95_07695 [Alphaproteobacteria bacterium]|nr:hypothetical protein [Alphaproteobacteria bacterium]
MSNPLFVSSILVLVVVLALPVRAAQLDVTQTTKCQVIERHVPDADVTYQPGRDVVGGEPVVPADLEGSAMAAGTPQNFDIEIDADLSGSVAGQQGPALYQPRAKIGRVEVRDLEGDTALNFNGQPLYRSAPGTASPECAQPDP